MRKLFYIPLIVLVFSTCQKEKLTGDYEKLVGTWQWLYSIKVCPEHDTIYPSDVGFNQSILIQNNGIVECFQNDKQILKTDVKYRENYGDIELTHYYNKISQNDLTVIYLKKTDIEKDTISFDNIRGPFSQYQYINLNHCFYDYYVRIKK